MTVSEEKKQSSESTTTKRPKTIKVILRRLPPELTAEELLEQVAPLTYDDFYFAKANTSLSPWLFNRAYFGFTSIEDVTLFRDRFNGYVFVDAKGNESMSMVELAPCQKVPKHKVEESRTNDPKYSAKLEGDADYTKFVEEKEQGVKAPNTIEANLEDLEKKAAERKQLLKQSTPLVEYVLWKKEERIRRQNEKRRRREDERKAKEKERMERERQRNRKYEEEEKKPSRKPEKYRDEPVAPRFAKQNAAKGGKEKRYEEEWSAKPKTTASAKREKDNAGKSYFRSRGDPSWKSGGPENDPDVPPDPKPKKDTAAKSSETREKRRNRERPDMPIYQPGKRKTEQQRQSPSHENKGDVGGE